MNWSYLFNEFGTVHAVATGFTILGNSFIGNLPVYPQRPQLQNWIFSIFHSTLFSSVFLICWVKNFEIPQPICFLILFQSNICQICHFFSFQDALNASRWRPILEIINVGKIGNILTLQLAYHGWIKHHMNCYIIKSSYYTKIRHISYLQYKFHVTGAIFTMKTISIHFPPINVGHVL